MSTDPHTTVNEQLPRDLGGVYRLTHVLGEGGMGVVYGGQHLALQRQVAVKMIRMALADKPEIKEQALKRFLREARAIASIDSPHVVHVHDFGRTETDDYYLVMDYIEGGSLHDLLRRFGKFPAELAIHVGIQVAKAIGAAHNNGIIHRDLKPSNVMVTEKEDNPFYVVVLDFGLAKSLQGDETVLTQTGHTIGTADTMAPEQIKESEAVDHRCDIYSFGVVLYNLVTGKRLFDAPSFTAMCFHHVYETPLTPLERVKDLNISQAFNDIIMKCLEKNPNDRFSSMKDAVKALSDLEDQKTVSLETIERMPLREHNDTPNSKSDIGQSDDAKPHAVDDVFFDAETMDHTAAQDLLAPEVSADSLAVTVRNQQPNWSPAQMPTKIQAMTPPTVPDETSWTEHDLYQTANTQDGLQMISPKPATRAWFLPSLFLFLIAVLGTVLFMQNQQIQSIVNKKEPVATPAPKNTLPSNSTQTATPPAQPEDPKKAAKTATPKPKIKASPKTPAKKAAQQTRPKKKTPTQAAKAKQEEAPEPKAAAPAEKKKSNPFMRNLTQDKKDDNKEKKNEFIRVKAK
jgi:serine/threonine protein kinase